MRPLIGSLRTNPSPGSPGVVRPVKTGRESAEESLVTECKVWSSPHKIVHYCTHKKLTSARFQNIPPGLNWEQHIMIYHAGNLPQYFIREVTGDPLTLKYWTYLNIDWILEKVFQTDGSLNMSGLMGDTWWRHGPDESWWCITNMTNGKYIHEIQHKTNLIRIMYTGTAAKVGEPLSKYIIVLFYINYPHFVFLNNFLATFQIN